LVFCVSCFIKVKLSVKIKLFVLILCVCAILPAKVVSEMTYTIFGWDVKPYTLTHCVNADHSYTTSEYSDVDNSDAPVQLAEESLSGMFVAAH